MLKKLLHLQQQEPDSENDKNNSLTDGCLTKTDDYVFRNRFVAGVLVMNG